MQKIREEDWLQTKINGALADYVRASEFKPTEERALTAVTMVKHLWAICFWGSWMRVCNFLWAARSRLIDVGGDSVTK